MLVLPARAKLNLSLEVVGRRPDGFHDLRSVVVSLDWHDLVGVTVRPAAGPSTALSVTGTAATFEVPPGSENLAHAAAKALAALIPPPCGIDVWLDKRLPVGAGLGGGSSDAAAVLRAGSMLFDIDPDALRDAAESLGSDVPATLAGGRLLVSGRGEQITPIGPDPQLHVAVAVVGHSSTSATFAALTDAECSGTGCTDRVVRALFSGRMPELSDLGSSLEPAAVRANPALGLGLERLRARLPEARWILTGSGGAAFALVPTAPEAASLARRVRDELGLIARACHTVE